LNDNGMSIAPNVGAVSRMLESLRTAQPYRGAKHIARQVLEHMPGAFPGVWKKVTKRECNPALTLRASRRRERVVVKSQLIPPPNNRDRRTRGEELPHCVLQARRPPLRAAERGLTPVVRPQLATHLSATRQPVKSQPRVLPLLFHEDP